MNTFSKVPGRVTVTIDGKTVADSTDVIALQEGSLPTRYYFPKADIDFGLLEPTDTHTRCGWKGLASYWTAKVGESEYQDIAWAYEEPLPDAEIIAGRVCFYDEKVDLQVQPA
ncbi:MAG TPA: DUF427 domain-containing protein [Acidimicrobiia bacterium]|jgi:uncharacterized protein (DUF427 family)